MVLSKTQGTAVASGPTSQVMHPMYFSKTGTCFEAFTLLIILRENAAPGPSLAMWHSILRHGQRFGWRPGWRVSQTRWSSKKRSLTLDEMVGYGEWWCKRAGAGGTSKSSELLKLALRKHMKFLELEDEDNVSWEDAEILLEETQGEEGVKTMIPLNEEEFEEYQAKKEMPEADEPDASEDWQRFQEFAEAELTSSSEILKFAEDRGAYVEVVNSAAKIKGHNGVQIDRLQCSTSKAWNTKAGDWKRVTQRLFEMGLREDIQDSAEKEYCKWCKKFQDPESIQSCTSTQRDCRRLASETWKQKL